MRTTAHDAQPARLLTPEEVRQTIGAKAHGMTDDDLTEIARRIRAVTRVLIDEQARASRSA